MLRSAVNDPQTLPLDYIRGPVLSTPLAGNALLCVCVEHELRHQGARQEISANFQYVTFYFYSF